MTFLVLGGTGRSGARVLDRLTAAGLDARSASRRTGFDRDAPADRPAVLRGARAASVCFTPDLAVPGVPERMSALGRLRLDGRNASLADGIPRVLGRPAGTLHAWAVRAAAVGAWA